MCFFINLVVPERCDEARLREVCAAHGRVLVPSADDGVLEGLEAGERAWVTTQTCDCDSPLTGSAPARDGAKKEAKLEKKGWSKARIEKWKTQRGGHEAQGAEAVEARRSREAASWCGLIADLLGSGVARVGLVVHWSSDDVRRGASCGAPTVEAMVGLQKNVIVFFG